MTPQLLKQFEKAVQEYRMIREGDHVLVGLSGVDSLVLLMLMAHRMKYRNIPFTMEAVHIDVGFPDSASNIQTLEKQCLSLNIPFTRIPTQIVQDAFDTKATKNPCFICSQCRRRKIYQYAHKKNCTLIAYGHHKDDIIETLLMNILYGRKIEAMSPVQTIFHGKMAIIRPLSYADQSAIRRWARHQNIPEFRRICPMDGQSRRQTIKEMIRQLQHSEKNANIRENIFKALHHVNIKTMSDLKRMN